LLKQLGTALALVLWSCSPEPGESPAPEPAPEPHYAPPTEPCVSEAPAPTQAGRLELPLTIAVGAMPAELSALVTAPSGREYGLSFFAFYVSQAALFDATGAVSPATFLAPDGSAQPYGVGLVDLANPETLTLRLAADPGNYAGLILTVGLPQPCLALDPHQQIYPLNGETGMTWDWAGYLHLRFEGSVRERGAFQAQLVAHHLFMHQNFIQVVLHGALTVDQPSPATLWLDVDRMLEMPAELAPNPEHGAGGWLLENLASKQGLLLR